MAQESAPGATSGPERPIVAFDFDGTMTVKDSFSAFLKWRAGPVRWWLGLIRLIPAGFAYLGHRDRGRIKVEAVREFLRGVPREVLEADAKRFAALTSRSLLRPDAVAAFKNWRKQEVRLFIVTASPTVVVAPFARGLTADGVVGTLLTYDEQGRVTGAFEGPNCRGPEKVVRLRQQFGPDVRLKAAYGDTDGDKEMLEIAEEPYYRVFTGKPP
jgi:phosphatidylglycerophosphatase C